MCSEFGFDQLNLMSVSTSHNACLDRQGAKGDEREIQPLERLCMLFKGDLENRWEQTGLVPFGGISF